MALHQPSAALHLLVALLGLADPTVHRMLRLQRVASGNHVLLLLLPRRRRLRLVLDLWLEGQKANLRAFSVADPALLRSRRVKGDAKRGGGEPGWRHRLAPGQVRRFPVSMRRLYAR